MKHRDKKAQKIHFEARIENINEWHYWSQSRTRTLILHSIFDAIINREFQAQTRSIKQFKTEDEAKRQ